MIFGRGCQALLDSEVLPGAGFWSASGHQLRAVTCIGTMEAFSGTFRAVSQVRRTRAMDKTIPDLYEPNARNKLLLRVKGLERNHTRCCYNQATLGRSVSESRQCEASVTTRHRPLLRDAINMAHMSAHAHRPYFLHPQHDHF